MQQFETLIRDARGFLIRLKADNSRNFFHAAKPEYDAKLKAPALELLAEAAPLITQITGHDCQTKLFRPQRDVRFAKDKTPYTTHLHMMWSLDAGGRDAPVCYFGIGLDYMSFGFGCMGMSKPVLETWRQLCDLDTARISAAAQSVSAAGFTFREPALKRVPQPYAKDHLLAQFLRMKSVSASKELDPAQPPLPQITAALTEGLPFLKVIESAL
ncbi:MAG: TIGR02453 family protein [Rhodobacteraceae bacterium]|nr:TIGR02453 family protein [Paracoccaceae bacterium]